MIFRRTHIKKLTAILSLILMLLSPLASTYSDIAIPPMQKGMCYVTWDRNRFATQYSDASLEKLSSLGVDHISICTTHYQEEYNSTKIKSTEKTPSMKSIIHAIKKSHDLGIKVMLKPHIDLLDKYDGTYWRADIGFRKDEDWAKWFNEYKELIIKYAKVSEKFNVEIFCIGTELSFTTQRVKEWKEIIRNVREVYSGKIVYASNWDNFKNIEFWNELDYVGIDAYFPLTYSSEPSIEDLKNGWKKWTSEIKTFQTVINKPVLFTELGYASTQHAPHTPWQGGTSGNADIDIQAKCYKAFFETIWNQDWLAGVYWWKWDTNTRAGGKNNRQFTPQNKPAQNIIEAYYKNQELPDDNKYAMAK